MSIVSDSNINTWMGLTDGTSESDMAEAIRDEVEAAVKDYCGWDFEETTYNKETYDGQGRANLLLKQKPVTRISSIAINETNALEIWNSSGATTAFAAVVQDPPSAVTGLRLVEDGIDDSTDLTFSTSTTITAIATVVNDIPNWNAKIQDDGAKKSTELIATSDLFCLDTDYAMFRIPDDYLSAYKIYRDQGEVKYWGGFPLGEQNIRITYTAGYSDCPKDLQQAVKITVADIYRRRAEEDFGLEKRDLGDLSMSFERIPSMALSILNRYKRRDVWFGGQ